MALQPKREPLNPARTFWSQCTLPLVKEALINSIVPNALTADPVIIEAINGSLSKITPLNCKDFAGPSGVDAHAWSRMCSSFKEASASLYDAIAGVAKCMCTKLVSPSGKSSLLACHLIPLNKNPYVRPIGFGEVARCNFFFAKL